MVSDWTAKEAFIAEPDKCMAQAWRTFDTLPSPLFLPWKQLLSSEFIEEIKRMQIQH